MNDRSYRDDIGMSSSTTNFFDYDRWELDQTISMLDDMNPSKEVQTPDPSYCSDHFDSDRWDLDQVNHPSQGMVIPGPELTDLQENNQNLEVQLPEGRLELEDHRFRHHQQMYEKRIKKSRTEAENTQHLNKQRLNHIKVERNRRQVINQNITHLKEMLPPHLLHKDDQASVIEGVVDFIGELRLLEETLQERKLMKEYSKIHSPGPTSSSVLSPPVSSSFTSTSFLSGNSGGGSWGSAFHELMAGTSSSNDSSEMNDTYQVSAAGATVFVTKSHTAVDVLIEALWKPRQVTQIIAALQNLHLNVMEMSSSKHNNQTLYLVIRTELGLNCRFTAQELATAIHQSMVYM